MDTLRVQQSAGKINVHNILLINLNLGIGNATVDFHTVTWISRWMQKRVHRDMGKCIHLFVFTLTECNKLKRYMERSGDQKDYGRIEMYAARDINHQCKYLLSRCTILPTDLYRKCHKHWNHTLYDAKRMLSYLCYKHNTPKFFIFAMKCVCECKCEACKCTYSK